MYGYPPGYGQQGGQPGYANEPAPPTPQQGAALSLPNVHEMGGSDPRVPPWYRMAFFPTSPFYSTHPNVGYQTRYYSNGILNQPANAEVVVNIAFDLPCRLIAINGSAIDTTGAGLPVGLDARDSYLFRLEYTNGDRLHIVARLGSTVTGSAARPGEIGGAGFTVDQGATVQLGITPLRANLRIDITLVALEMRGPRNFK